MKVNIYSPVLFAVFVLLQTGCRTTRQTDTTTEYFRDSLTEEHHASTFDYTLVDSLLSRWSIVAEGFEAHVSIPMVNVSLPGEISPIKDDTTSDRVPRTVPPVVTIDLKAHSLHIDGLQQERTEVAYSDSSERNRKATSQEYNRSNKNKKTTRMPAYIWWAAIPFILFLIYIVRRWLKKR